MVRLMALLEETPTQLDDGALGRLAELARTAGAAGVAADAEALDARLAAGRLFVACVGQFKRGKSTLLNALVGARVLPVGVQPVTSVVTILRHGAAPRACITFADGRSEDAPVGALAEYVTETNNPGNIRRVAAAEVFLPSALLRTGVCLVDTPGVGSVFADNTNATRRFVPHIDAALVVLGADPPISADELALVSEIAREAPALVFVMAKADRLSDADLVEARAFTERVLADRLDREVSPPLIVSATERVSLGRPTRDWFQLEARLIRLGSTERAAILEARHARGVERLGGQLLVELAEERRILEQPLEDAERRVAALVEWTAQAEIALRELGFRLAAEVQHFAGWIEDARQRFLGDAEPELGRTLERGVGELAAGGFHLRERAFGLALDLARARVEAWNRDLNPDADAEFRTLTARLVDLANGFLASLADTEPALRSLPPLDSDWGLDERRHFYFHGHWTLATPGLLRRALDVALPATARGAFVRRAARAHLQRLLETNSYRVAGDLRDRAVETRRQLEGELGRRLESLHEAGARALGRARAARAEGRPRVERELARARQLEEAVRRIVSSPAEDIATDGSRG